MEIEEKSKLLEQLKKRRVCLNEEEAFVHKLLGKFKVLGNKIEEKGKCHDELVLVALKYKLRDNNLQGKKVRRRRDWLRGRVEQLLDSRSSACRTVIQEVKEYVASYRQKLKLKNTKKVDHLVKKHGMKKTAHVEKDLLDIMGRPKLFVENDVTVEKIKDPVIVEYNGETVELSEDEIAVLKLGPKFCVFTDLNMEEFETDLEESILKVKWDMMTTDKKKDDRGLEDVALEALLGSEICNQIDNEKEEDLEIKEAEYKTPFSRKDMTFNLARRRVTDLKGNSRVTFPSKPRSLEEESAMETLRMEMKGSFSNYVGRNCGKGGRQNSNLTTSQCRGLKSLKKRAKEGDLVIVPTDKSGNLAVMTRLAYIHSGMKHTLKDREVGWEYIKECQREVNGHVSMLIKYFKIGSYWGHGSRIRETTMGEGMSTCPLSLLYKDHKGWSPSSGTVPPTRPVIGGHMGINMHLSEIVSDILDPVVSTYVGGKEIISTEDLIARVEILNEKNVGWSPMGFWGGLTTSEFKSCGTCEGIVDNGWNEDFLHGLTKDR